MDFNFADEEWKKLQFHIDRMFGPYLKESPVLIEHKSSHATYLLEMSRDDKKDRS